MLKIPHHEFWNANILLSLVWPHYLWNMLRTLNPTYFTAANPAIEDGGFFGEKKSEILELIPFDVVPDYIYIDHLDDDNRAAAQKLGLPVIIKPNIGQRGFGVRKIEDLETLNRHLDDGIEDVIIQKFVESSLEYAVLFYRLPGSDEVNIGSVVRKEYLSVKGDGTQTVLELVSSHPRYYRYVEEVPIEKQQIIPAAGENLLISEIGNHIRGTIFRDARDLITEELRVSIENIVKQMDGVFYGRFDLKCPSEEDFQRGENLQILELNGVTSDPAHIFDPEYSLRNAIKDLYTDARIITRISKANIKRGAKTTPLKELISKTWKYYFNLK